MVARLPAHEPAPQTQATPDPSYEIDGTARSGKTPLPGAAISASNTLTGKKFSTITGHDGRFSLNGMTRGRYVVRIEFMGFAVFTQELVLNPENPLGKIEAELILASRQQQQSTGNTAGLAAGRGFQTLAMDSTLYPLAGGNGGFASPGGPPQGSNVNDVSTLPLNGAGV